MIYITITIAILTTCSYGQIITSEDFLRLDQFTHYERLDANYELFWKVNGSHIVLKTVVRTNGYVGLGLSPNGGMAHSDIVIGWVQDGVSHFSDRHSLDNSMPVIDHEQNWFLLLANENESFTTLVFIRQLDTCDTEDVKILTDTSRIIFSYHPNDPHTDDTVLYHGTTRRGTRSLMLLDPANNHVDSSKLPHDVITIDLLNNKFRIPGNATHYNCLAKKIEHMDQKHHMIRYEPVIQSGHEQIVHHIVLYYCTQPVLDTLLGIDFSCMLNTPTDFLRCDQVFVAWAIGGQAFNYPDHVGHPLGTADNSGYFLLETHFNNPERKTDFVDSSGVRLYLTKQLRQYDAAVMDSGVSTDTYQIIPPYEKSFLSSGYCHEDCLNRGLGETKIHVLAVLLHAHLLGRKVRTRHFRNGTELPPIMEDNNYDFDYQQMRLLPGERIIQKGDSLVTECDYDSTGQTEITYGGLASTSEMCQSFLLYFPKLSLSRCISRVYYKIAGQFAQSNILNIVNTLGWTSPAVRANFQQDVNTSPFVDICYFNSTQFFFNLTSMPALSQHFVPDSTCP